MNAIKRKPLSEPVIFQASPRIRKRAPASKRLSQKDRKFIRFWNEGVKTEDELAPLLGTRAGTAIEKRDFLVERGFYLVSQQDRVLVRLWNIDQKSRQELAQISNCSVAVIEEKIKNFVENQIFLLSDRDRELVRLWNIEGRTQNEIADIFGVRVGVVAGRKRILGQHDIFLLSKSDKILIHLVNSIELAEIDVAKKLNLSAEGLAQRVQLLRENGIFLKQKVLLSADLGNVSHATGERAQISSSSVPTSTDGVVSDVDQREVVAEARQDVVPVTDVPTQPIEDLSQPVEQTDADVPVSIKGNEIVEPPSESLSAVDEIDDPTGAEPPVAADVASETGQTTSSELATAPAESAPPSDTAVRQISIKKEEGVSLKFRGAIAEFIGERRLEKREDIDGMLKRIKSPEPLDAETWTKIDDRAISDPAILAKAIEQVCGAYRIDVAGDGFGRGKWGRVLLNQCTKMIPKSEPQ